MMVRHSLGRSIDRWTLFLRVPQLLQSASSRYVDSSQTEFVMLCRVSAEAIPIGLIHAGAHPRKGYEHVVHWCVRYATAEVDEPGGRRAHSVSFAKPFDRCAQGRRKARCPRQLKPPIATIHDT